MDLKSNNQKSLSTRDKLKNSATGLILASNIHGLSKIITRGRISFRIIWLILIILSACLCVYYVVENALQFTNYDTITKIDIIKETQSQFPTVSICNYNDTNFEFKILNLQFNYESLKDDWSDYFEIYNDSRYGKCFRFNSGKNIYKNEVDFLNSTARGYSYGLNLELYVPVNYLNDFGELKVFIHNNTMIPANLYNKGFFIKSGSYNFFSVRRIFEQKLGEPFNKCYKDLTKFNKNKTLIHYIQNNKRTYSQDECFQLCQNLKYIETSKCNCSLPSLDDVIKITCISKSKKNAACSRDFLENFQKSNPFEICSDFCPLECDSINYEIQLDSMPLPTNGRVSQGFYLKKFNSYENVSKSFISINVYYEELKYTLITQHPKMQIFGLVSSIGGIFSLFLGMSLLSFIEIFEILIESAIILFNK